MMLTVQKELSVIECFSSYSAKLMYSFNTIAHVNTCFAWQTSLKMLLGGSLADAKKRLMVLHLVKNPDSYDTVCYFSTRTLNTTHLKVAMNIINF